MAGLTDNEFFLTEEGCWISQWWDTTDDPVVSLARARVEPGVTTNWHSLDNVTERYVILEGAGHMQVGAEWRKDVTPGDSIYIPDGTPQRIANTGSGQLLFLVICTPRFDRAVYRDWEPDGPQRAT